MNLVLIGLLLSGVSAELGKYQTNNEKIFFWATFPQDASESTTSSIVAKRMAERSHMWPRKTLRLALTTAPRSKKAFSGPFRTRPALWGTSSQAEEGPGTQCLATGNAAFFTWGVGLLRRLSARLFHKQWQSALKDQWTLLRSNAQTATLRPPAPWLHLQLPGWRSTSENQLRQTRVHWVSYWF